VAALAALAVSLISGDSMSLPATMGVVARFGRVTAFGVGALSAARLGRVVAGAALVVTVLVVALFVVAVLVVAVARELRWPRALIRGSVLREAPRLLALAAGLRAAATGSAARVGVARRVVGRAWEVREFVTGMAA